MITAIIMASGYSTRMGKNKLLMKFRDISLIENIYKEINKVCFKEIIVVSQYEEVLNLARKYGFKCILNNNAHIGQSESIKLGLINSYDCDGFMFFVGDQPLIDHHYINLMIDTFNENKDSIIIPKHNNKTGNPVIFPKSKKNELLNLKNDEKGKKVIQNHDKIRFIDVSEKMLEDIDTREDFDKINNY